MSFFSSIPTWGWFDIGFNVAVLVALGGETDVILRLVFPDRTGHLLPPETKRKKLKKFCELLLILGIAGEISCLPFSLYGTASAEKDAADAQLETTKLKAQIAETTTNLDPRNQPISDLSAVVTIALNEPDFIEIEAWDGDMITGMQLHNEMKPMPRPTELFGLFESLSAVNLKRERFNNLHEYIIHFEPDVFVKGMSLWRNVSSGSVANLLKKPTNKLVKDLDVIHEIELHLFFIPSNVEVLGGSVELIANGEISKKFLIPPRKADASPRLPGLFLIATNSIGSSQ